MKIPGGQLCDAFGKLGLYVVVKMSLCERGTILTFVFGRVFHSSFEEGLNVSNESVDVAELGGVLGCLVLAQ